MKERRRKVTGFLKIPWNRGATGGVRNIFGWDARPGCITRCTDPGSNLCDEADGSPQSVNRVVAAPPQRHRPRRASRSAISLKEGARQTRNALASLVIRSLPSGEKVMWLMS